MPHAAPDHHDRRHPVPTMSSARARRTPRQLRERRRTAQRSNVPAEPKPAREAVGASPDSRSWPFGGCRRRRKAPRSAHGDRFGRSGIRRGATPPTRRTFTNELLVNVLGNLVTAGILYLLA